MERTDEMNSQAARLGPRFRKAMVYAACLHEGQARKETKVPYIAHLLAVCALVLENGADGDVAIAALLHDAVEDQGGRITLGAIHRKFGERVAKIVEECTDSFETPKPPWEGRKAQYILRLASASAGARLVATADKLHNVRSILIDYRQIGDEIWKRFKRSKDATLGYYRRVTEELRKPTPGPLVDELIRTLEELEKVTANSQSD
jgi:(p)ppGpp synthase/HD superfamily hydrolase